MLKLFLVVYTVLGNEEPAASSMKKTVFLIILELNKIDFPFIEPAANQHTVNC